MSETPRDRGPHGAHDRIRQGPRVGPGRNPPSPTPTPTPRAPFKPKMNEMLTSAPGPCAFWGSVSLPGHRSLSGCPSCYWGAGGVLRLQRPGSGYWAQSPQGSLVSRLPTSQGPQRGLPGLGQGSARARPGDATSSFKEQTKMPVPGRGRQLRARPEAGVHTAAPPGLWPGPVAGVGRHRAPASSGNQPGLREPASR